MGVNALLGGGDFPEHIASIDDSVSDFIGHAVFSLCLNDVTEVGCWQCKCVLHINYFCMLFLNYFLSK